MIVRRKRGIFGLSDLIKFAVLGDRFLISQDAMMLMAKNDT